MSLTMLPPSVPAVSPVPRDRFIDVLRVLGMALVVVQHWTMPVIGYAGGVLSTGNALAAIPLVTWLSQVMPLVFFAGGAANAISFRRAGDGWTARRIGRLGWPVLPLAAVWLPLPYLLGWLGVPAQPLEVAARIVGQLLWFLAVYVLAVVATPYLIRLRAGVVLPVLAGGAVLTDAVRFAGFEPAGYLNVAFVWLAVHQIGFLYAEGRLAWLSGCRAAALAVAGFAMVAALVAAGPYPASMIGMPGAVSNMAPPSACLLALFAGQLGLAMLLRPALNRLAARPRPGALLGWLAPRMMTIYLWHMPALVAVAGVAVVGLGVDTPAPGSGPWWALVPVWLLCLGGLLSVLIAAFGRFERPPAWVGGSAVLVGGALATLMVTGFPPGPVPVLASAALLLGLVRRPAAVRRPR
ncbi:acyltransferase [Acrocarpospora phusangensis]|uniref:Acyltransferase n=1 Tax=Acrocarpospora phusangensis TaxID=1070424 RepID=A0A919QBR7_9ACTN|nr:acyltransferase [Acrocarpospora phusangensis]GIH24450.1 acyltransferase [Acrocarpospora phusangensis]